MDQSFQGKDVTKVTEALEKGVQCPAAMSTPNKYLSPSWKAHRSMGRQGLEKGVIHIQHEDLHQAQAQATQRPRQVPHRPQATQALLTKVYGRPSLIGFVLALSLIMIGSSNPFLLCGEKLPRKVGTSAKMGRVWMARQWILKMSQQTLTEIFMMVHGKGLLIRFVQSMSLTVIGFKMPYTLLIQKVLAKGGTSAKTGSAWMAHQLLLIRISTALDKLTMTLGTKPTVTYWMMKYGMGADLDDNNKQSGNLGCDVLEAF